MGNTEIHLGKCEIEDPNIYSLCEMLKQHKLKMHFINNLGEVLEKLIYTSPNVINGINIIDDDSGRTSLYQIFGDSLKKAGQMMDDDFSFKSVLILIGRTEKMMGQIENLCLSHLNSLFLVPIQKIRIFNKEEILPISLKIGEITDSLDQLKSQNSKELADKVKLETEQQDFELKFTFNRKIIEKRIADCNTMMMDLSLQLIALVDLQTESLKTCLAYFEGLSKFLHSNQELFEKSTDFTEFSKLNHFPTDYRNWIYKKKLNIST